MWILILTLIINPPSAAGVATSISTVPITFNDYNTCMEGGKQWATLVKSRDATPSFVCVKHYARSER